ncbi:DoxX family protein [soil metagenome]
MESGTRVDSVSKARLWSGWILSGLPAAFLLLDGAMKLVKAEVTIKPTLELGYSEAVIIPLGAVLLVCVAIYLIPRTAVLGAILLTGYLGGAVATHVRAGQGAFEILFPVLFGVILWSGLALRDRRIFPLAFSRT